jgi:phage shock protein A
LSAASDLEAKQKEVDYLQTQCYAMSNTIEALKQRVVELEWQLVDAKAAAFAAAGVAEMERMLSDQASSQLQDGDDH